MNNNFVGTQILAVNIFPNNSPDINVYRVNNKMCDDNPHVWGRITLDHEKSIIIDCCLTMNQIVIEFSTNDAKNKWIVANIDYDD